MWKSDGGHVQRNWIQRCYCFIYFSPLAGRPCLSLPRCTRNTGHVCPFAMWGVRTPCPSPLPLWPPPCPVPSHPVLCGMNSSCQGRITCSPSPFTPNTSPRMLWVIFWEDAPAVLWPLTFPQSQPLHPHPSPSATPRPLRCWWYTAWSVSIWIFFPLSWLSFV